MESLARSLLPARTRLARVLMILLLTLAACSAPGESTREDPNPIPAEALETGATGSFGGTLHYALAGEPGTFNPVMATNTRDLTFGHLLHGYLFEFDPQKGEIRGGVVREWARGQEGRSLLLTLRQGVRFSDGEPLTPSHIVKTFQMILSEESSNPLKGNLLLAAPNLKVRELKDHRVEIDFGTPYAAAEYLLSNVPILPTHRFPSGQVIDSLWGLDADPASIVGLGPFVMQRHEPGQRTVLAHNPHYWRTDAQGRRLPFLDQFVVEYVSDRNTQLLRFRSQELDLLDSQLRPEDFQLLVEQKDPQYQLFDAGPSNNLYLFWLNLGSPRNASGEPAIGSDKARWFGNTNFRRALDRAISREAIVENVFLGYARPAWGLIPEIFEKWQTDRLVHYPHDVAAARRLLSEAGFSWQKSDSGEVLLDEQRKPVSLNILTRSDDIWGRIAALLQQDLKQIGIAVSITQEEFRSVISRITRARDYEAALLALAIPVEPSDHGNVLLSSSPMHFWNPMQESPETDWEARIDELMMAQLQAVDPQARQAQYAEVQELLSQQVPIIPLINNNTLVAAQARVQNLKPAPIFPNSIWNGWELWVKP